MDQKEYDEIMRVADSFPYDCRSELVKVLDKLMPAKKVAALLRPPEMETNKK